MKRLFFVLQVTVLLFLLPFIMAVALAQAPPPSGSLAPKVSTAAEGSRIICTANCSLFSATVTSGAAAGFLLVFNQTTVPADGAVAPIVCINVAANSTVALSYRVGLWFPTGLVVVYSTTGCFTKTISNTAMFSVGAQ